jgi:tRNA pseudouridine38-40 synthase
LSDRNIKLVLSYDGSAFSGWQIQPDRPTIQGTLANVIERITAEKVLPQGSGRTDAGVHALAQVASFQSTSTIPLENFVKALNSLLPESIRILSAEEVPADFHARHCAQAKTYEYRVYRGTICPPFIAKYVYHHPYPLDEEAMKQAAALVIGEHDFTSFAAVDPERYSSQWERRGNELVYIVRGNGFLHHMVRNLVGTFLTVGKGSIKPGEIGRILDARNRSAAGATAPARGLYLMSVEY